MEGGRPVSSSCKGITPSVGAPPSRSYLTPLPPIGPNSGDRGVEGKDCPPLAHCLLVPGWGHRTGHYPLPVQL